MLKHGEIYDVTSFYHSYNCVIDGQLYQGYINPGAASGTTVKAVCVSHTIYRVRLFGIHEFGSYIFETNIEPFAHVSVDHSASAQRVDHSASAQRVDHSASAQRVDHSASAQRVDKLYIGPCCEVNPMNCIIHAMRHELNDALIYRIGDSDTAYIIDDYDYETEIVMSDAWRYHDGVGQVRTYLVLKYIYWTNTPETRALILRLLGHT